MSEHRESDGFAADQAGAVRRGTADRAVARKALASTGDPARNGGEPR